MAPIHMTLKAVLTYWDSLVKRARKNTDGKVDKLIEEVDK